MITILSDELNSIIGFENPLRGVSRKSPTKIDNKTDPAKLDKILAFI
jgi:hypothetical protein